jgi:hypothetical protein
VYRARHSCVSCVLFRTRCPHVSCVRIACVAAHASRAKSRVSARRRALFAHYHIARTCLRVIRALFARRRHFLHAFVPRIWFVCRAASTRDNKLLSLINAHVKNVNR